MVIELENALKSGSRLAEFRILEVLGVDGFGITYKAYDEHLDDYVAIKEFFPAEYAVRKDNATVTARSTKDQDFGSMRSPVEATTYSGVALGAKLWKAEKVFPLPDG